MVFFNSMMVTVAPANAERVSASLTTPLIRKIHWALRFSEEKKKIDMANKSLMGSIEAQNY
jgi:hypothetical protein